jgi:hypothetical protein
MHKANRQSTVEYQGLTERPESVLTIPGVMEAGWSASRVKLLSARELGNLQLALHEIVKVS